MKTYILERTQFIAQPIAEVFSFFERPENLARITPPDLAFRITSPLPIEMKRGALIEYTIRVIGVPVRWRTHICDYDPPHGFADEQQRGPYSLWHHAHTFEETNGGTTMTDRVTYALPFGFLGRIAHAAFVRAKLRQIFDYRAEVISRIFESMQAPKS